MKRNKRGISLVVLVITIIVMIILAAAVIISLSDSNIINKANEAVTQSNLKQVQQLASLIWTDACLSEDVKIIDESYIKSELIKSGLKESDVEKYNILVTDNGVDVWIKKVLTTSTSNQLTLTDSNGTNLADYKIYGNSVQNGTPTPNAPVEVESVGDKTKNLFDLNILTTSNYTINNDKVTVKASDTQAWSDLKTLTLKPNTQYCLSTENSTKIDIRTPANVKLFNQAITKVATFTTDSTGLVCFKLFGIDNIYPHEIGYIQLEEGTTATAYEPYGKYKIPVKVSNGTDETTTNIYLDEPLRKIGDMIDYIDLKNKKVVRNIKTIELTLNLNYTIYKWNNKVGVYVYDAADDDYTRIQGLSNRNNVFDDSVNVDTSMWIGVNNKNVFWTGILTYLGFADDETSTAIDKLKEWLDNNPTYIYYPTSIPTEETVELPNIPTIKGTTMLSIDTKIQPSNIDIIYNGDR